MKKLFVTMLAVAATATSFAQNPDALKQVLAAEKKSDAVNIMKEQGASMTAAERAKGYNHIVGLSVDENSKAAEKSIKLSLDPSKKDEAASSKQKQYKAAADAVKFAIESNKADQESVQKGEAKKAKFKKDNANKAATMRADLFNGGLEAYNAKNYADADKWFGLFVDSHDDPLFDETDAVKNEKNYNEVAYYAALACYFNKDYKKCGKYAKIAEKAADASVAADGLKMELSAYDGAKNAGQMNEDDYLKKYSEIYKANPTNSDIFARYVNALYNAKKKEEGDKILNERLKQDPNDVMANAYLGQNAQEAADKCTTEADAVKCYDDAISAYEKVIASKPDFDAVKYNLAVCTRAKGVLLKAQNKPYKDVLAKAKKIFQEIQAKDPEEKQFKTKYILSTIDEL